MPVLTFAADKKTGGTGGTTGRGFSGLCTGINNFCTSATPIIACILIAELIIIGIKAQINKGEGKQAVKSDVIWVIIGTGVALCASSLGTEISGWFAAG